jgi:hypothetical protein
VKSWSSPALSSDDPVVDRGECRARRLQIVFAGTAHFDVAEPRPHARFTSVVSSPSTSMYFRSTARRRFALQFDLIVFNGGSDEIF